MSDDHWNPDYYLDSPIFEPVRGPAASLANRHCQDWPGLDDYQHLFEAHTSQRYNRAGRELRFVPQGPRPKRFADSYEARIYLRGEIQTRAHNWHDYFQVLVWCLFPRLKASLNARHFHEASRRLQTTPQHTNRGAVENALALFDECGVIIASDEIGLLECIRDFHWKELFWRQRQGLERRLSCIVFGHALYQKALSPYVGLTGQALLLKMPDTFHGLSPTRRTRLLDRGLADIIDTTPGLGPECLTPFPLLGMPDWDGDNGDETYYDNTDYFRPGRQKPRAPIFTLATRRPVTNE